MKCAAPLSTNTLAGKLSAILEDLHAKGEVPGICAAVSTPHGEVEVATGVRSTESREPLSSNAHFHLGCVSKLLLSIVALEHAQSRAVDLNAPISGILTELAGSTHGEDVALIHLLSHTAGYRAFPIAPLGGSPLTWDRFVADLVASTRQFEPGFVFNYEHTGAVLIAEVLQRATGIKLAELLRKLCTELGVSPGTARGSGVAPEQAGRHSFVASSRQFRPFGGKAPVRATTDNSPSFWRPAFSNLTLSMVDLAKVGRALCGSGSNYSDESVLPTAVRALLQKPVVRLPLFVTAPNARSEHPEAFSLGAAQYSGGWHGISALNGGQSVALRYHPGLHISAAVGMNCWRPYFMQDVARSVCEIVSGEARSTPGRKLSVDFTPSDLEGKYDDGGANTCEIHTKGAGIVCSFRGASHGPGVVIEVSLNEDPPVLIAGFPGAAVSFFRTAGPHPARGLMFGLNAYRRRDQ